MSLDDASPPREHGMSDMQPHQEQLHTPAGRRHQVAALDDAPPGLLRGVPAQPSTNSQRERYPHSPARQLRWEDAATPSRPRPLIAMLLDVEEGPQGSFHCWGRTRQGSILLRVQDFEPYWFIPSPTPVGGDAGGQLPPQQQQGGGSADEGCSVGHTWRPEQLHRLRSLMNMRLTPDCHITAVSEHHGLHPIMYYRPALPNGSSFLRLAVAPGGSVRKAAGLVHALCKDGGLDRHGFQFTIRQDYEADVKPLTRFLCDTGLSGGSWLCVSPAGPDGAAGFVTVDDRSRISTCGVEVVAPWASLQSLTPDATQLADPHWLSEVMRRVAESSAAGGGGGGGGALGDDVLHELAAATSGAIIPLRVLTLDVQLAPSDNRPRTPSATSDPVVAIACELREVQLGADPAYHTTTAHPAPLQQAPPPPQQALHTGSADDIIDDVEDEEDGEGAAVIVRSKGSRGSGVGGMGAALARGAAERVLFLLSGPPHGHQAPMSMPSPGSRDGLAPGRDQVLARARVVVCRSEAELLLRWRDWVVAADPDAVATFQVRDTLGALAARAAAIKLDAASQLWPAGVAGSARRPPAPSPSPPGLYLSRLRPQHSQPLGTKSVVMYSVAWVKSQARMSGNSNQETFRVLGLGGRLVFDVLRQVLTYKSLATFSLADCVQTLLHQTLEVLGPAQVSQLWCQVSGSPGSPAPSPAPSSRSAPPPNPLHGKGRGGVGGRGQGRGRGYQPSPAVGVKRPLEEQEGPERGALNPTPSRSAPLATSAAAAASRLGTYCFRRTAAVTELMAVLATIPEAFEMARVTGLGMSEVQYKAQMVRTWSLLLRNARRHGYLVGGRQEATQLIESPYLMHPIEHKTAALYTAPVACLDFASLYPSLYRAYNMCYTTLVVGEDVNIVGRDHLAFTPSGHAFLKPAVRQGILPSILAALMTARRRTRDALKATPTHDASARAVLDSRQKALKVTANALYGFTGAQASPLQCVPLADSCLAYGAQACRTAISAVDTLHREGVFGPAGRGARVIYGQTDSLFVLFPHATIEQAVALGKQAAQLITERWFVEPMQLQYERVCAPFLLLHVNRYAGRSFETEEQAMTRQPAGLLVKGVRSMWRQSAPFLQRCLHAALDAIIMRGDVPGAVQHTEQEIHRLLSGRVELWELIMTGGLWRVTGQQVAQAAAAHDGTGNGGGGGGGGGPAAGEGGGEEVRGPHAALAVKLAQRDPGRTFLLGERIQYVLLSGARLQDDAAEDPVLAAELGLAPNLELYWRNKLQAPLAEIFEKVLPPSQLAALLGGPHTLVRADNLAMLLPGSAEAVAAGVAAAGVGAAAGSIDPARATAGLAKSSGRKQAGLAAFFKASVRCLGCKQTIPAAPGGAGDSALPPGLCAACVADHARRAEVLIALMSDANAQQATLSAAAAQCARCHSGGMFGMVACVNGECNVLFARLGSARRLAALDVRQRRLDVSFRGTSAEDW